VQPGKYHDRSLIWPCVNGRNDTTGCLSDGRERRFMDKFPAEALRIQREIIAYMKQVVRPAANETVIQPSQTKDLRADLDIKIVDDVPCMPQVIHNIPQSKDDLEGLLRRYLNAHYSEY